MRGPNHAYVVGALAFAAVIQNYRLAATHSVGEPIISAPKSALKNNKRPSDVHYNFPKDLSSEGTADVALFYNVYWNPRNTTLSYEIIQEQLEQRNGKAIKFVGDLENETEVEEVVIEEDDKGHGAPNATLYYFTLGAPKQKMPPCQPCVHLGHQDEGFEDLTLQAMFEYCQRRPQDTVVYFHNKGSYTPTKMNHRLRRHLTKAVFSKECLRFELYNVCTAMFMAFPNAQCVGNFFSATCEYISKLIPPNQFEGIRNELHQRMLKNDSLPWYNTSDYSMQRESWLGTDRYALENWVGSHPHWRPGNVYSERSRFTYTFVPRSYEWEPRLRQRRRKVNKILRGISDFYKQRGRLHLYQVLYGEIPRNDSWFWHFYRE